MFYLVNIKSVLLQDESKVKPVKLMTKIYT